MGFTILSQSTIFFYISVAPITTSNFRNGAFIDTRLWELKDSNLVLRIFSPTHRPSLLNSLLPMLSNHRLLGKSGSIPSNAIDGWLIILGYRIYFLLFHIHIKRLHVHAHHSNLRNIQNLTQCNLYKFYVLYQKLRYQNSLHL